MPKDMETVIEYIKIMLVVTGICVSLFPILYLFSPWYRSHLGRAVMIQSMSVAFAIDISVVRAYWLQDMTVTALFLLNLVILAFIAGASMYLVVMLLYYNFQNRETQDDNSGETVSQ
jgi:hypothetical protein